MALPANTASGAVLGIAAFGVGFGVVWWMWWLAALCVLGAMAYTITLAFLAPGERDVPAAEVAGTEQGWIAAARSGSRWDGDPLSDYRNEPGRVLAE